MLDTASKPHFRGQRVESLGQLQASKIAILRFVIFLSFSYIMLRILTLVSVLTAVFYFYDSTKTQSFFIKTTEFIQNL